MEDIFSNIKIVILGTPSVGKTSLRRCYLGENFRKNYIETIGSDFSFKSLKINDKSIGLALWDLAGQEKFLNVHPLFYKGSYGCVVVYSVVDRETFDAVPKWIERFMEESNRKNLPIMLIGNKIDLLPDFDDKISIDEEKELVDQIRANYPNHPIITFRTSALTGENVDKGFTKFAEVVQNWILDNKTSLVDPDYYMDDIDKNIPGAYAMVMNQITGPQLIATSPTIDFHSADYGNLSTSAVKLIASLDFNDVISQSSIISSFPWMKPRGDFYYIAFVIDNTRARGKKELFVIGINVSRELNEPIYGIKGVLDGLLYNSVNEVVRIITNSDIDYITSSFNPTSEKYHEVRTNIEKVLKDLRSKLDKSLKRWYNIPE